MAARTAWEYLSVFLSIDGRYQQDMSAPITDGGSTFLGEGQLNELGAQGWELTHVLKEKDINYGAYVVLRRELHEEKSRKAVGFS